MVLEDSALPRAEGEIFADLAALCVSPGYAHAVAAFCFRDNMMGIKDGVKPEHMLHLFSRNRLLRTEISTLIGLMVKAPFDLTLPDPATLQGYLDRSEALLEELHKAISGNPFEGLNEKLLTDSDVNPFSQANALREPIFYGGESAYSFQYRDFAPAKYGRDDPWLREHRGFEIATAHAVVKAIVAVQARKVFGQLQSLKGRAQREWTLLPGFVVTAAELAAETKLPIETVTPMLEAFALGSDDRNGAFNAVTDYNVTNAAPLLRVGDGAYLLYQIYSIAEAVYESPFYWMGADKAYVTAALDHRGLFTEEISRDFLERVFGKAHAFSNVKIPGVRGETRGEIDVLVLFGDRAIVVQAKSKRLTLEARRGNDVVLKDDFKKAIQNASDQAMVCARLLLEPDCKLVGPDGAEVALAMPIKQVFPICVVADHYPALNFQARQFLKVAPAPGITYPLTTDIFALDAMSEMLTSPLRFLSYLSLRARAGDRLMAPHEHTILGYHLRWNLWVEDQYGLVMMQDDVAAGLDAAMIVRREGLPGARTPDGILTRLQDTSVMRLLAMIDAEPAPAVLDFGLFMLEADEDSIRSLSNAMDQARAKTRADGAPHDATMTFGNGGITIHTNRLPDGEARTLLADHCRRRKYFHRLDRWFGLSLNPDTGGVRFGLTLDQPWIADPVMDAAVAGMDNGQKFHGKWPVQRIVWPGRNDLCHCGSGRKYKKCHLQSDAAPPPLGLGRR
jgi:hypothetical protein